LSSVVHSSAADDEDGLAVRSQGSDSDPPLAILSAAPTPQKPTLASIAHKLGSPLKPSVRGPQGLTTSSSAANLQLFERQEFLQVSHEAETHDVIRVGVMAAYESLEDLQADFTWLLNQFGSKGLCVELSDVDFSHCAAILTLF
jgi:hypothetical protein